MGKAMETNIILIGPPGVGKSTVARTLGAALGLPVVELDTQRWDYYAEIGYDRDRADQLLQDEGLPALVAYWKPFDLHALERVLADHRGCVIAFGAGHSVYEDASQFARARRALAPYPYVVLLLPSPDIDESVQILNSRLPADDPHTPDLRRIQERLIRHHSNYTLATITVYTKDKTPEETCRDILAQLGDLKRSTSP